MGNIGLATRETTGSYRSIRMDDAYVDLSCH
jgi:hypothetical protein